MCDTCSKDTISLEVIDSRDTPADAMRPVIDAAFAADKATTCCLERKNAISRAVFDTATALGYGVAWGDVLDDEGPDFYLWPADSWRTTTIRKHLEENRAHTITRRDLR